MRGRLAALALILGLLLTGCAAGERASASEFAPEEGERLVVYTSHKEEVYWPIIQEFEARTGIWVEVEAGGTSELLARLRVALRRARQDSGHAGAPEAVFTNGELKIDYAAGCTYLAGQEVHLTPIEYKLLCLLAKNVGKVLTHNFILKEVWGSALPGDTPSLRVFMATLRKKIEPVPAQPKYIQTHVGVGYRMLRIAEGEPVQKNG